MAKIVAKRVKTADGATANGKIISAKKEAALIDENAELDAESEVDEQFSGDENNRGSR